MTQRRAHTSVRILGTRLDSVSYSSATDRIIRLASRGDSGYICAANVHMIMEGHDDPAFLKVVNGGDLVVPDGMPLVWAMRLLGVRDQQRVYGPILMQHCLGAAEKNGITVGLLGGRTDVLDKLIKNINKKYPNIRIVYSYSPPFMQLSSSEKRGIVDEILESSPQILFVALGCPKQERWMAAHTDRLKTVMLGVGAAFDFYAGEVPMAPAVLQRFGLEWAYRLGVEPRRLFLRYAKHNPRFVAFFLREMVSNRLSRRGKI